MQRSLHASESRSEDWEVIWDGTQKRDKSGTKGELLPSDYAGKSTLDPKLTVDYPRKKKVVTTTYEE